MRYDWLVVGAGFSGATFAERLASQHGARVLVIDRRKHVGGNAYDEINSHGNRVQVHGAHIFHTGSLAVWRYLSQFTEWFPYKHKVLADIGGKLVPLPVNTTTIDMLWPKNAESYNMALHTAYGSGARVPIAKLRENHNFLLQELAERIYETIFRHYTAKQWGLQAPELDQSVTARVPIVVSRSAEYFRDTFQGIPAHGYTRLIQNILNHPNIDLVLGEDAFSALNILNTVPVMYSGPIDEYFHYEEGPLPYRSLHFLHAQAPEQGKQQSAVINFPDARPYTRKIDHSHFSPPNERRRTVTYEFPEEFIQGQNEPYYPVPTVQSRQTFLSYAALRRKTPRVLFSGRLADYKYYDMHQVVARSLMLARDPRLGMRLAQPSALTL